MPPRYAYWTIIAGGLPTAFRAADRAELMPTFQRIREKHPDAEMKWFARGKLWDSPEAARNARSGKPVGRPFQGRDWRPGGEHRDPRQKFKDAKRERNLQWRTERFERKRPDKPVGRGFQPRPANAPAAPKLSSNRPSLPAVAHGAKAGGPPQGGWRGRPLHKNRPFARKRVERNQGTEEPQEPQRPQGPNREPHPDEAPEPTQPPRPSEPIIVPPPPERGTESV